ncbi:hypothetical protein AB8B23_03630 [Leptotrichia sp. HSP-342]|uniref:Uncharacterized protein n=1 Tax=Leptotrichia mesophila TaxID=3239303 RepID=A0AB39VC08_9FUSO
MMKKVKLQKTKFLIMALMMISMVSINGFSAKKAKKEIEWKQITLEPDLDGDGIKDKIEVEYAEDGNDIHLTFIPYIFNDKAKFVKGKSIEKTMSRGDFETKFDTFIKTFIAEYPKKNGTPQPVAKESKPEESVTEVTPVTETPSIESKPEESTVTTTTDNQINDAERKKKAKAILREIRKTAVKP